jgi:hypothetical protein
MKNKMIRKVFAIEMPIALGRLSAPKSTYPAATVMPSQIVYHFLYTIFHVPYASLWIHTRGGECAMQGSNPKSTVGYQTLTTRAPQLAPQCCKWPEEVEEIGRAWAGLAEPLRAAILGIVRSASGGGPKRSAESGVPPKPPGMRGGVSPSPLTSERGARPASGKAAIIDGRVQQ